MNPKLIRLLASQYRELQGLKTIADAAFPLGYGAFLSVARSEWDLLWAVPLAGALFWLRFAWLRERIEDFYESRCGRTDWRRRPVGHTFLFMQAVCLGVALMTWPAVVRVVFLIAMLAGLPIIVVARDAPYRLHWLLPALVGVAAAIVHGTLTSAAGAEAWEIRVSLVGGAAIAFAGVCDHLLLMRMLPGAPAQDAITANDET